jgi:hypothetical protein
MSEHIIPAPGEDGFDAGDRTHVRKARDNEKRTDKERASVVSGLMTIPEGRKWLWDFMSQCGIYTTPFSENALVMAFNTGKADVGRRLLADIVEYAPDAYVLMIKEHQRK